MPKTKAAPAAPSIPAVIYARYSSHSQTEQSIEGQLHDAYAFAERNGYRVIAEYIDRAQTGTRDARPDFQRMIRDAEKRQFQVIIVWKLDRFARNRYDSAIYKARLKKYGVRVVSVMENLGEGPEAIIMEGVLESMAEYYSANLAENVRRGLRETVAKGLFAGGPVPYGYRVENRRLVEDERTGPIAREIFRRYADGESPSTIAADLNARGYRTRLGHPWRVSAFDSLVLSPVYGGQYTYNGEVIEGAADAIIDEDIRRRALERREKNRRAPAARKARERYLLQGKIFCGHCGASMVGECGYSRSGTVYHYYACSKKKKSHTCRKKNERKDFIEWYVCEQTVLYILDPARLDLIADRVVEAYNREFNNGQVQALERTLARLDADMDKLIDSLLTLPESARPRIAERMERIGREKADAEADLAKARIAAGIRLTKDQVKAWLRTFQNGDLLDEDFRQRIIDTFINSVYLYDDKVVIFYNVRNGRQESLIDPIALADEAIEDASGCSDLSVNAPHLPGKSEPLLICVHGVLGIVIFR